MAAPPSSTPSGSSERGREVVSWSGETEMEEEKDRQKDWKQK